MAKEKLSIDSSGAVAAIEAVTEAVKKNSKAVRANQRYKNKQTTEVVKLLTAQAKAAKRAASLAAATKAAAAKARQAAAEARKLRQRIAGLTAELRRAQAQAKATGATILSTFRSVRQFVIFGVLFKLQEALFDSIGTAKELAKAISEIKTISANTQRVTNAWNKELRELSNNFGVDIIVTAEAAYQTLSNQVISASSATEELSRTQAFLAEEAKLATIAVGSLDEAVQATTSVINAFGRSTEDAGQINAILFQTIEQGRTRLSEFANILGRVSVLSNQLGISFLEQQTALSFLTRQGIKTEEALTLLRNVELRLIKPTGEMEKIFSKWGFTSGQAAIQSLGLVNVLAQLAQEANNNGDEAAELGKIFGRLRTIVGGAALSSAEFSEEMSKFKGAGTKAVSALEQRMKSLDKRLEIQTQRARNYFTEAFGKPVLKGFVTYIEKAGGAEAALDSFFATLKTGIIVVSSYSASLLAVNGIKVLMASHALNAARGITGMASATALARGAFLAMNPVALASTAIIGGLAYQFFIAESASEKMEKALQRAATSAEEAASAFSNSADAGFNSRAIDAQIEFEKASNASAQAYSRFIATVQQGNNAVKNSFDATFNSIHENITRSIKAPASAAEKALDAMLSKVAALRSAGLSGKAKVASDRRDLNTTKAINAINAKSNNPATLNKLFFQEIVKQQQLAADALSKNDKSAFDDYNRMTDRLIAAARDRLKQLESEASRERTITRRQFNPVTGRMNNVSRKVPADRNTALKAAQGLKAIEQDRLKLVELRINREETFANRQVAAANKQQKILDQRKKHFADFQATLAKIDSFDKGGKASDLRKLVGQAGAQAQASGLDFSTRAQLLAQGNALILTMERKHAAELSELAVQAANKKVQVIKDQQKQVADELSKALEAEKKNAKDTAKVVLGTIEELRAKLLVAKDNVPRDAVDKDKQFVIDSLPVALDTLDARVRALNNSIIAGPQQFKRELQDTVPILGGLVEKFKELGFLTRKDKVLRPDVSINTEKIKQAIAEYTKSIQSGKLKAANDKLTSVLTQATASLGALADKYPELRDAATEAWVRKTTAAQNYQQVLNSINADIEKAIRQQAIFANGGQKPKGFAFGGRVGFDAQPALLREGETVMNPLATKRFGPMLDAMNAGNTTNIDVGGISVSGSPGVDANDIANMVMQKLNDQKRLNL